MYDLQRELVSDQLRFIFDGSQRKSMQKRVPCPTRRTIVKGTMLCFIDTF